MQQYAGQPFDILGTPCNQFGGQEPGDNDELLNGLAYVRPGNGFVPAFPLTQKMDVNGAFANPLWTAIRSACACPTTTIAEGATLWSPISTTDVTWNFASALVSKTGILYRRYDTLVQPSQKVPDINFLLSQ